MIQKEQVAAYLAANVPVTQIAAALGCEPSYISQLKEDTEVRELVAQRQAQHTPQDVEFDLTLEDAEALALRKIRDKLPLANMAQSLAAFKILNGAKKRTEEQVHSQGTKVYVNLLLPQVATTRYIANDKNEIVEVDGRTLLSASAEQVTGLLNKKPVAATDVLEKAAARLGSLTPVAPREVKKVPKSEWRLITPDML